MAKADTTTSHEEIRKWIEAREGRPSIVEDTADNGQTGGILRVDFGDRDETLKEIGWDEFFRIFDDGDLAFLYQDETAEGSISRFHKFVARDA